MHCDLKPENLLLESNEPDAELKIIDMGLGQYFNEHEALSKAKGSLYYMAPEQLLRKYNHKVDVWACGVIFYILVTGRLPFGAKKKNSRGHFVDDPKQIQKQILRGDADFHDPKFKTIEPDARRLLRSMLSVDPAKRPEAREVLEHPWFSRTNETECRKNGETMGLIDSQCSPGSTTV